MTAEQKIAFINAQTARMLCEAEELKAANREREQVGHSIAYGEREWASFNQRWAHVLEYNEVISFFRDN